MKNFVNVFSSFMGLWPMIMTSPAQLSRTEPAPLEPHELYETDPREGRPRVISYYTQCVRYRGANTIALAAKEVRWGRRRKGPERGRRRGGLT